MQTREILADYIENHDLCPGSSSLDEWLGKTWLEVKFGEHTRKLIPLWGLRQATALHDVHHVLAGYPTTPKGEAEIAAWELASGGCSWNLVFWLDRLTIFLIGLIVYPRDVVSAFRRGGHCRNLYGSDAPSILSADVAVLRKRMRL